MERAEFFFQKKYLILLLGYQINEDKKDKGGKLCFLKLIFLNFLHLANNISFQIG